jgi:hypothetical protein
MALTTVRCPECSGIVEVAFASRFLDERLIWSASHRCRRCPYELEQDEDGIPDEWRERELRLDGLWGVRIISPEYSESTVLRTLQTYAGLTDSDIDSIPDELPGSILAGTWAEMERICHFLAKDGIESEVVRSRMADSEPEF